MRGRGGAALAAAAFVAVLGAVGCSGGEAHSTASSLVAPDDPSTTAEDQALTARQYQAGDCVTWLERGNYEEQTRVVPCTQAHWIQISARVTAPRVTAFPTEQQWQAFEESTCAASVTELLGRPLDPSGRFTYSLIEPSEGGWKTGDRVVWCGVGRNSRDHDAMLTEDARGADQLRHFAAGQCVEEPPQAPELAAVPCTHLHHFEATGEITYPDAPAPPHPTQESRCDALARQYLGHRPSAPWGVGFLYIAPASWAAGTRTTVCYVAQWGADGKLAEVGTSAKA